MSVNLKLAEKNGIIDLKSINHLSNDTLEKVSQLLELIRKRYNVSVLIQSNVTFKKDIEEWQCLIGRRLDSFDGLAQTFANGTGKTISEAMVNSLNEFIEYYNINKSDLS